MIIQCEKCKTKFRLDDSRVTDKGVKVRCTKCKHVFRVHKNVPDTGIEHEAIKIDTPISIEKPIDSSEFSMPDEESTLVSFASDDQLIAASENSPEQTTEPASKISDIDFSDFNFADCDSEPSSLLSNEPVDDFTANANKVEQTTAQKPAPQGLDFSDDDIFGAVVPSAPEVSGETITFDFGDDSFSEAMQTGGHTTSTKSGSSISLDTLGDTPFSFGEIDFGEELTSVAVRQVNPEDLKPSQEILFAPLAKAQDKSTDDELTRSFLGDEPERAPQELPPLSIASRRKQNSQFGILITLISVLVLSVLGYFGYSSFSTTKETVATEAGKISVRALNSSFIDNPATGELLVVSGEALNQFSKPRAALQIKVTVFDAAGVAVATKVAYGGNPLTEEQIESLPLEKLEAAMGNQFGDSLANMEVAPGKAIPFVVVIANLPKGAKDFEVVPAGSTVATGKQQ